MNQTEKQTASHKKNILPIVICSVVLLLFIVACTVVIVILLNRPDPVEAQVKTDIEVFSGGDITEINRVILQQREIPEELKEYVEPEEKGDIGLMADLIALAEIQYVSQTEKSITLSITAPDMSRFHEDILPEITEKTDEEDLKEMILEYAESAEKTTREVELSYNRQDGLVSIRYYDEAFLTAVTGDFAAGYREIYAKYLKELTEAYIDD